MKKVWKDVGGIIDKIITIQFALDPKLFCWVYIQKYILMDLSLIIAKKCIALQFNSQAKYQAMDNKNIVNLILGVDNLHT